MEGPVRVNPTHPVNIPCGRKPEYPEKTDDFRQSVDYVIVAIAYGIVAEVNTTL